MTNAGESGGEEPRCATESEVSTFESEPDSHGFADHAKTDDWYAIHATRARRTRLGVLSLAAIAALVVAGVRVYKEVASPAARAYWVDYYEQPGLSFQPARLKDGERMRAVLAVKGRIGAASARRFVDQLAERGLSAGDVVLLSSPGGDLVQGVAMGEAIRARGLLTAVGELGKDGALKPSFCASACVAAFAGGTERIGILGSSLGVHRFSFDTAGVLDPVAEAQRATGRLLGYMTGMGVSAKLVEMMTTTSDIRWLAPEEALSLSLVTRSAKG